MRLSLNKSKINLLIFRPCRNPNITLPNLKLNNFMLYPEETTTYLVLRSMKIFPGTNKNRFLLKKLSRTNPILSKLRYYVSKKPLLQSIYFHLLQSFPTLHSIWLNSLVGPSYHIKTRRRFLSFRKNVWDCKCFLIIASILLQFLNLWKF